MLSFSVSVYMDVNGLSFARLKRTRSLVFHRTVTKTTKRADIPRENLDFVTHVTAIFLPGLDDSFMVNAVHSGGGKDDAMAEKQMTQIMEDFATVYKTLFFDLPLIGAKWGMGISAEKETTETAWKAYDASVRLATTAIDNLYRNPFFSQAVSRTFTEALRWQRIGNAVSGTVLTGLWRTLGVPTAAEVQGLSDQVRALETRLAQLAHKKDVQTILEQLRTLQARLNSSAQTQYRNGHLEARVAA